MTDLAPAVQNLKAGKLVAFPTETVYGLGADAANEAALAEVFRLKGRPSDHPLIVHLAHASLVQDWARDVPPQVWRLAEAFWPGPLTLVLQRQPWVSDALTGGQQTVAVRVPAHPLALALLEQFGGGVAAPSANRFGGVSPTMAAHVRAEFGDAVMVLDGGPCDVGLESTILDLSAGDLDREAPRVLRPGQVTVAALEALLQITVASGPSAASPRVSGSLARHYAPQTPTFRLPNAASVWQAGDGILTYRPDTHLPERDTVLILPDDADGYGHALYGALRSLDARRVRRILIEEVPGAPAWAAVSDRLSRASRPFSSKIHSDQEEIHG